MIPWEELRAAFTCDILTLCDEYIPLQFTGLLDKTGKEIYEGDIIKIPNEYYKLVRAVGWKGKENAIEVVVYDNETGSFMGKDVTIAKEYGVDWQSVNGTYLWVITNKYGEVIGNIFENPILLEANKKDKAETVILEPIAEMFH